MKCTGVYLRNGFKLIKTILKFHARQYSCLTLYQFQHLDSFDLTTVCFAVMWSHRSDVLSEDYSKSTTWLMKRPDHNTVLFSRLVRAIFNIPQFMNVEGCETGPAIYSPYSRRLESLTICGCYYKGSAFSSIILRPWVLGIRPESNSRSPA